MVTLTWHACKYKVHKLHQRCILIFFFISQIISAVNKAMLMTNHLSNHFHCKYGHVNFTSIYLLPTCSCIVILKSDNDLCCFFSSKFVIKLTSSNSILTSSCSFSMAFLCACMCVCMCPFPARKWVHTIVAVDS